MYSVTHRSWPPAVERTDETGSHTVAISTQSDDNGPLQRLDLPSILYTHCARNEQTAGGRGSRPPADIACLTPLHKGSEPSPRDG